MSGATLPRGQGRAILVGAGPGDPDLMTLRGVRAMASADLVLYDALVDARILELAPKAQRFFVGKRAGRPAIAQSTIHALMLRAARRGRTVVRLKSGDPFVFGRGGEEAIACHEAGVPCEVVPGVSSAIAGPAAFGIPVTHRDVSPGVLVLSASPTRHYERVLATLEPGVVTVVLMMALGARRAIAEFLERQGWPADLPAAVVVGATREDGWSWRGTLRDLGGVTVPDESSDLPGLLVIGHVVSLADTVSRATLQTQEEQDGTPWRHRHRL